MRLERARRDVRAEAPDVAEQLLAREDAVGVGRELHEKRELLRRKLDLLAGTVTRRAARSIGERADLDELDSRWAAPQERVDARKQLLVDERARQAVVGAGERADAGRGISAAQHDHRAVGHDAAVERVGVTENEDVGIRRARQLLGPLAGDDVETVVAQLPLEESANSRLRLGEKECGQSPRLGAHQAPPDVLSRERVTCGRSETLEHRVAAKGRRPRQPPGGDLARRPNRARAGLRRARAHNTKSPRQSI